MSSGPKRHVGEIANTGARCVVVFMQIPDRPDHALVVSTGTLEPRYEQNVIDLINSTEGQAAPNIADLLGRRVFPDTGMNVLETLHKLGKLVPMPIDSIVMKPMPNQSIPLRTVLELMGARPPVQTVVPSEDAVTKVNPYGHMDALNASENQRGVAESLLTEAALLDQEANLKRERAYRYAPDLRPVEPFSIPLGEASLKPKATRKKS